MKFDTRILLRGKGFVVKIPQKVADELNLEKSDLLTVDLMKITEE
jgi:antitoxin component of MazEF toxin-antitoxin module